MSLRRRLLVIVMLAAVALVAATAAIGQLVASSDANRFEAAEVAGDSATSALVAAVIERGIDMRGLAEEADSESMPIRAAIAATLGPFPRLVGGYCRADGEIIALARGGRRIRRNSISADSISPEHASAVAAVCRQIAQRAVAHERTRVGNEVFVVTVTALPRAGVAAWAGSSVRSPEGGPPAWKIAVFVLAGCSLLLVIVTVDAMFALRQGARDLGDGLRRLKENLRAPLVSPRAKELAEIANEVQAMAAHLADAQAREHQLAHKLAHEQRLAALGRVVAGVAHEIRNPLAGMKLRLDWMVRGPGLDPSLEVDIQACLAEINRLDRVVRSLLGVARRDGSPRKRVLLGDWLDQRIALSTAAANEHEVTLVRRGDGELVTEPDALSRAFDNLLRNAIEASPRGGQVSIDVTEPGNGLVGVEVIDQGEGVPRDREQELFEPFFTTKPAGTGLGLWMSRSLIDALGGRLQYRREAERTYMSIELPQQSHSGGPAIQPGDTVESP